MVTVLAGFCVGLAVLAISLAVHVPLITAATFALSAWAIFNALGTVISYR